MYKILRTIYLLKDHFYSRNSFRRKYESEDKSKGTIIDYRDDHLEIRSEFRKNDFKISIVLAYMKEWNSFRFLPENTIVAINSYHKDTGNGLSFKHSIQNHRVIIDNLDDYQDSELLFILGNKASDEYILEATKLDYSDIDFIFDTVFKIRI